MKVRFLGDYDFNGEIIDGLLRREPSIDFISGFEADSGAASSSGRTLMTFTC
jgi:hypothetical protein